METPFENSKGYKVIAVSAEEVRLWPRTTACDHCKSHFTRTGFYVAAYDRLFCYACYEKWHQVVAEKQPEQCLAERRHFKFILTHEQMIRKAILANISTHILLN